jgi:hypothetical protein
MPLHQTRKEQRMMYPSEKNLLLVFLSMPTKYFLQERKDQRIDPNYYMTNVCWRIKQKV